jgi:hypothetical protein
VAAREKTIKEQNERVAKLEKTIKDMQALLEIKNKDGRVGQTQHADSDSRRAAPVKPEVPVSHPRLPRHHRLRSLRRLPRRLAVRRPHPVRLQLPSRNRRSQPSRPAA